MALRPASEQEQRLVQYLLGSLSPEEQAQLEERYMVDNDLHEELLATADDLIHAYLTGNLSPGDRRRFEVHFLASPRRRQRVAFVERLLAAVERVPGASRDEDQTPAPPPARGLVSASAGPRKRYAAAAAAALLVVVAALLATVYSRGPGPDAGRASGLPPVSPESVSQRPPESPATQPPEVPKAASGLPPGGTKANQPRVVVRLSRSQPQPVEVALPPRSRWARLEVALDDDDRAWGFGAALRSTEGAEVWRVDGIAAPEPQAPIVLDVPAEVLTSGDYVLSLEPDLVRGGRPRSPLAFTLRVTRPR